MSFYYLLVWFFLFTDTVLGVAASLRFQRQGARGDSHALTRLCGRPEEKSTEGEVMPLPTLDVCI